MSERYYSGAELAKRLAVNAETIRRHAAAGKLKSVRVGRVRRYSESAVQRWLAENGDDRR